MKIFLVGSAFCILTYSLCAQSKVIAHCSGFVLPNGLALSFDYVTDPKSTGLSKPEIHSYEQYSRQPNAPIKYLGPEVCEGTNHSDGPKIICVTELSETYTLDPRTKTGTETGDGYRAPYKCEFF